jgi:glucan-binding YG repeat protein
METKINYQTRIVAKADGPLESLHATVDGSDYYYKREEMLGVILNRMKVTTEEKASKKYGTRETVDIVSVEVKVVFQKSFTPQPAEKAKDKKPTEIKSLGETLKKEKTPGKAPAKKETKATTTSSAKPATVEV